MNLISLFITSILSENIILDKFLGISSFFDASIKDKNKISIGIIITLIVMASSLITSFIYRNVLVSNGIMYLKTIVAILVIVLLIKLLDIILNKFFKPLYEKLSIDLSMITINSAIFGLVLLNIQNGYKTSDVLIYSLGSSIGYMLIIYVFTTIKDRMDHAPIIRIFRGLPITFITLFIMALVFSRYISG